MKILKPAEAFDKSAQIYQDKFMDVSIYAEPLHFFCDKITVAHARILDIACGPGNITKYLTDIRPGYDILGIDLAPKMLDLGRINVPGAEFQLMDCRDIGSIEQKFDGIVCGFCLPYLTREETFELIANVSGLLNNGGLFYLSTMEEDETNKSRYQTSSTGDQVYVNYYPEAYLREAMLDNNFEIISVKRFSETDRDGRVITDLVLIGKLG